MPSPVEPNGRSTAADRVTGERPIRAPDFSPAPGRLEEALEGFQDTAGELSQAIAGLRAEAADLHEAITVLRAEMTDLRGEITELRGGMADLRSDLRSVREQNSRQDAEIWASDGLSRVLALQGDFQRQALQIRGLWAVLVALVSFLFSYTLYHLK
jgi:septal ring factor EnvC (AmiA/AmiB activator)